jgi:hypothetical protein
MEKSGKKIFEGFMMANLALPAEEDGVPFVSVGGLTMLAITAIDLRRRGIIDRETTDLSHLYEQLAAIQGIQEIDSIETAFPEWRDNPTEVFSDSEVAFNIKLPPIAPVDVKDNLRQLYRKEKELQRAL